MTKTSVQRHHNYAELQRHLSESRALTDAAEAHGTLSGALCASASYGLGDWLAEILPEDALGGTADELLQAVYESTHAALTGTQMQFELVLPDDTQPLARRTEALGLWCNGFVYGLGMNGADDPEKLPGDAGEIVRDLSQIMRAGVDEADGLEANESALTELIEFVRVGVQVIFEDLSALRAPAAAPASVSIPGELPRQPRAGCIELETPTMKKPMDEEFARRRRQLMRIMGRDSIAILPAAPLRTRNNDVHYGYRQDSDFHYLSGFPEPEAVLALIPGRPQGEYVMFVRERNAEREIWDGKRAGPEGARRQYGADDAFPITDIDEILPGLIESRTRVYHTMGVYHDFDQRIVSWVNTLRSQARMGAHPPQEFVALDHVLHDMRLYKSRRELALMRRSGQIAAGAHVRAMKYCRPGLNEHEVMAEIVHEFGRHAADTSYYPIVGGGANSCVLHYNDNNQPLKAGDLLLIDAGCEHEFYASDITRTFPVSGRFSREQRAVYDVVLAAQHAAFAKVKPGNHWNEPHDAAVRAITQGLVRIGLLKGPVNSLIRDGAYKRFFMHRTGHWLGIDVHDVGDYKVGDEWRIFEPGMVLTVEPGIYIPAGSKGVPKGFWNIGIRIEDDVAVTRNGCEVLTDGVPTDADAIEKLMAAA